MSDHLSTISDYCITGAIRKNLSNQDATDEAVQNQVPRYQKGAADRAGGRRRCGGTCREGPAVNMNEIFSTTNIAAKLQ